MSNWLRPDAETSPERLFCHCYARGKGNAQMIPGWPYSMVVALEPGRTSWTLPLDAVRLGPADDATEVTAAQVREVAASLIAAASPTPGGLGAIEPAELDREPRPEELAIRMGVPVNKVELLLEAHEAEGGRALDLLVAACLLEASAYAALALVV